MPEMRISLTPETEAQIKRLAKHFQYNKREFVTRALNYVAEYGAQYRVPLFIDPPFPPPTTGAFTFIDLFAGIGGIRLALQGAGGKCVLSAEWDRWCKRTYVENFAELPMGDVRKLDEQEVPDHDVLAAGFPCQPFSIAGVSKKKSLGHEHGFRDQTQGTLFFEILRILNAKRPAMFLLENVKNLKSHDRGRTFEIIHGSLVEAGYQVRHRVIDARHWVPQHRERVFLVGVREDLMDTIGPFKFPRSPKAQSRLEEILEPADKVEPKYTLSDKLWAYLQEYAEKHRAKGNGFGFGLCTGDDVARTLSARYYKDGSEILIDQGVGKNPRRLTPRECARLMGFPEEFQINVSDTQAYKQFGNSVVVPVVESIASKISEHLQKTKT